MDAKQDRNDSFYSLPSFLQLEENLQKKDNSELLPELSALDIFAKDERNQENDMDYMRKLYPRSALPYLSTIEEFCDKMEYKGSMMYDECPDKISIQKICDSVCKETKNDSCSIKDLLQVLLLHEIYHRRCRYRQREKLFHNM